MHDSKNGKKVFTVAIAGATIAAAFSLAFVMLTAATPAALPFSMNAQSLLKVGEEVDATTTRSSPGADDGQSAMLARGDVAMGFDQGKIRHHFMATPTGGQIMIVALDGNGEETISQIRAHVLDIQQEFSQGNFTKPFFIHAQEVPGTAVMEEKKDLIKYSVQDLDDGAVLVLTTDDGELLQAIQQFMTFQGSEHHGH